ncbi:AMP-binding protein [Asticcacaulis sp. DXS10W]|uniref:AMP-binding protein n=1 Tax=Asticcacaulis currens TaxID=2984210 RepID=A0ABT5IFV8_9CAUL|nr:AMP-binding protein [Asticcacaulis currens]MDC7694346.1 AMP-binding protein [Asticcacaulis currens]
MSRILLHLKDQASLTPDRLALVGNDQSLSLQQLISAIDQAAFWLSHSIENKEMRPVALALDNGPAWVVLDLALIQLGWPCLPLPPFFSPDQTRHALNDAGAIAIIKSAYPPDEGRLIAGERVDLSILDLSPRPLPTGTAKITYTSGSTGTPKGVCLSLAQMEAVAFSLIDVIGAQYAGRHLALLPLGVLLENVAGLYTTLLAGGVYDVNGLARLGFGNPRTPDAQTFLTALVSRQVTSLILVPDLLQFLMAALVRSGLGLPALRFVAVGGAKVSPGLLMQAAQLGLPVYEGYGLSECASVVALNPPLAGHTGTVGKPLPHLDLRIDDGGEIHIRHRQATQSFLGYVGGPEAEAELKTGDLGTWAADGYLRITGRKKNLLILSNGRNVSPEWIEAELLASPQIAQAFVFGEAQATLSALIVPRGDADQEALAEAIAKVNASLPPYAQISAWRIVAPFDASLGHLTANGRLRRDIILSDYLTPAPEDMA